MIALIDNYDSFTYNLFHYIGFYDEVKVLKNTDSLASVKNVKGLSAIVISPGPSHPKNSMLSLDAIDFFKGRLPIFGVCLGMQAIGYYFGFEIRKAKKIMHGKVDEIKVLGESSLFGGLPESFMATRYHSLVVDGVGGGFSVNSVASSDREVMGIESGELLIFGVQFHPESYTSEFGLQIVRNFVKGVVHDNRGN